jgi:hypothetical protein
MLPPAPVGKPIADAHRFRVAQILSCQHRSGLPINDAIEDFFRRWNNTNLDATSEVY